MYRALGEVRNQDSWMLIALLLERRETQDQAWEFVQSTGGRSSGRRRRARARGLWRRRERSARRNGAMRWRGFLRRIRSMRRSGRWRKSLDYIDDCIHLRAAQEPELRKWLERDRGK